MTPTPDEIPALLAEVARLTKLKADGQFYSLNEMADAAPALAAEVERLREELAEAKGALRKIKFMPCVEEPMAMFELAQEVASSALSTLTSPKPSQP